MYPDRASLKGCIGFSITGDNAKADASRAGLILLVHDFSIADDLRPKGAQVGQRLKTMVNHFLLEDAVLVLVMLLED